MRTIKFLDTPKAKYNREYNREKREWLKSHGICIQCGKNEVDKPRSNCYCLQCRIDHREQVKLSKRNQTTEVKYFNKMRNRKYRELLVAFGVCVRCGKHDADPGYQLCSICRAKAREMATEYRRKKGAPPIGFYTETICCQCKKEKPADGRKLCPECYEKACASLAYGRQFIDRSNHIFRKREHARYEESSAKRREQEVSL